MLSGVMISHVRPQHLLMSDDRSRTSLLRNQLIADPLMGTRLQPTSCLQDTLRAKPACVVPKLACLLLHKSLLHSFPESRVLIAEGCEGSQG